MSSIQKNMERTIKEEKMNKTRAEILGMVDRMKKFDETRTKDLQRMRRIYDSEVERKQQELSKHKPQGELPVKRSLIRFLELTNPTQLNQMKTTCTHT